MSKKYDYLVIGSGPAGYVSAIQAAQLGQKVAVVEKDVNMVGGVCLNEGCIPAKSLYKSADMFSALKKMPQFCGIDVEVGEINLKTFVKKSRESSEQLSKGILFLFKKNNIDLIIGEAKFIDASTIEVNSEKIESEKFLIATGSSPRALPLAGFDGKNILSSSDAIRLEEIPLKVLIIGGGAIGTEFASYFNLVGAKVTIIEMEDSLLPGGDKETSKRLASIFKQSGIDVLTSLKVDALSTSSSGVQVEAGGKKENYDKVIVSIGRAPNTALLDLGKAGVETDKHGFIKVDDSMRTSAKNIFASGDVLNTPMLAHMASAEGEVAAEVASGGEAANIDYTAVPYAVYTQVQVASVGLTEEEAKEKGLDYSVGKQFFKSNGKAVLSSASEGFIKVIADNKTRKILGVHIIGHEATELIHEFVVAKRMGLSVDDVAGTIHAHPTLSETAVDACKSVFGKPIHG